MFDLVAGFCQSQILLALIDLEILQCLADGPRSPRDLALAARVPEGRMNVLLNGGAALGLITVHREVKLTPRGAALLAVPGLPDMIRHHETLYRDLSDPVAFFRGETETELAAVWPYVFGDGAAQDPARAARYSRLMEGSMALVAEDTLAAVDLTRTEHLMDVGGGTGAFIKAVAKTAPKLDLTLFDLPAVTAGVTDLPPRARILSGSFRDGDLPRGADVITLVRVLYDHDDASVGELLARVRDALPPKGRVIISEPMSGCRAGDSYFALYCMAMRTGQVRSVERVAELLREAGFGGLRTPKSRRPFVTSVVEAVR